MDSSQRGKKLSPVFIYASIIVLIVVLAGAIFPSQFDHVTNTIKLWTVSYTHLTLPTNREV